MRLLVALTEVFRSEGGIPMFNRALLRALSDSCQRTGAEARVLVLNDFPDDVDSRYVAASAVRVQGCQRDKVAFVLRYLRALAAGPDLVVLGHVNLLSLAVAARARGCPYWLLAHGVEAWQRLPWLARRALARARTVLAVSDYTRQQLARQNGLSAERWRVFPNALDPFWAPVPETPAARPTLLSVTRLDARERGKGIEQVLEVLPRLRAQIPALRYVVVGEGDDRPRLQGRARALGVDDGVEFTGYLPRPELARLYAACDVFVLPSILEGFGIVFVEAMAHAKPVVAARAGGAPEVVAEGETGLLVEPGDLNALQAALLRLLTDPELRRRLGTAGRQRVQENFNFDQFGRRLARLLVHEFPRASYLSRRQRMLARLAPPDGQETTSPTRSGRKESTPSRLSKDWWETNPMSYAWRQTRVLAEGSSEFFDDVDQRFFCAAWFAQPAGEAPFSGLIDLSSLAGQRVLEVGCGLGSHAELLSRAGARLVAVDITERATRLTRGRLRLRSLPGAVLQADGEALPFADQSFDLVWSWGVIHHFPQPERAIREILRVLRPGGRVSLMVYHRQSLVHWINLFLVRGVLWGQLLVRSLPDLLRKYSDGYWVHYYCRREVEGWLARACQEVETGVFGQLTELLPLPRRIRDPLVRLIPRSWSHALLRRWGSFLWITGRKQGASPS